MAVWFGVSVAVAADCLFHFKLFTFFFSPKLLSPSWCGELLNFLTKLGRGWVFLETLRFQDPYRGLCWTLTKNSSLGLILFTTLLGIKYDGKQVTLWPGSAGQVLRLLSDILGSLIVASRSCFNGHSDSIREKF